MGFPWFSGLAARWERRALTTATGVLVCGFIAVSGHAQEGRPGATTASATEDAPNAGEPEPGEPETRGPKTGASEPSTPESSEPQTSEPETPRATMNDDALAPPPPEPKPGDQKPAPFLESPKPRGPLLRIILGVDGAVVQRFSRVRPNYEGIGSARAEYNGPRVGGHALLPLLAPGSTASLGKLWLGLRLSAAAEWQKHDDEMIAIHRSAPVLTALDLEGLHLGVRFEPGIQLTERFRALAVLGVAWTRFQTASYEYADDHAVRSGAVVEFPLGVGLGFEVLPNWLDLGFSATFAPVTSSEGSLFEPAQIVVGGRVLNTLAPVPGFESSFSAALSLGVIL